jgi:hypothetical protein
MTKPKTHYEQVPLEIVKKIVEEPIQQDKKTVQTRETKPRVGRENPKS